MYKRVIGIILHLSVLAMLLAACGSSSAPSLPSSALPNTVSSAVDSQSVSEKGKIILSTTTSTDDSGLLNYILPEFTKQTGWKVEVIAVGTGAALQMGRDGQADVLLVHARSDEEKFVAEGYAPQRYDVMYNDFLIVGPSNGPIAYNNQVDETFKKIASENLPFISRGDDSGTHKKELSVWKKVGIDSASFSSYISAGQGMGASLGMAVEKNAYILVDRATWLSYSNKGALTVICEKSEDLLNHYGVIPVSGTVNAKINTEGGQAFANWLTGAEGQKFIGEFGKSEYGQALFTPNAKK